MLTTNDLTVFRRKFSYRMNYESIGNDTKYLTFLVVVRNVHCFKLSILQQCNLQHAVVVNSGIEHVKT